MVVFPENSHFHNMEISSENLENIQLAGDSAFIPDKSFPDLIKQTCCSLSNPAKKNVFSETSALSSVEPEILKQAYAGVATLLLEATKHDQDEASISALLEDCKFTPERIKSFNSVYKDMKAELQILLSSIGSNPPHIVDVDWRLDYNVKTNHLEKVGQPTYTISLKTEECGLPGTSSVDFSCTQDQLQDLVGKLKDACKSMERASQS